MSDSLFRKLWLNKLPAQTTLILATLPDDLDLMKTAEIADKINDVTIINGVDVPTPHDTPIEDMIYKLQQQINKLSAQMER